MTKGSFKVIKDEGLLLYNNNQPEQEVSIGMMNYLWEFKIAFCKKTKLNIPWHALNIIDSSKKSIEDVRWTSNVLEEGKVFHFRKRKKQMSLSKRISLLQHKHATGRFGNHLAQVTLNSTKDYVIIMSYDYDIDYLFSQSVDDGYFVYHLDTMDQVIFDGLELSYRYQQSSGETSEEGVNKLTFDDTNPYQLLVYCSDVWGKPVLDRRLSLPKPIR